MLAPRELAPHLGEIWIHTDKSNMTDSCVNLPLTRAPAEKWLWLWTQDQKAISSNLTVFLLNCFYISLFDFVIELKIAKV